MNQGRLLRATCAVLAGLALSAHAKDFPAVPGEYIVKLKPQAATVFSQAQLESAIGGKIVENVAPKFGVVRVAKPIIENQNSAIATLSQSSIVEYAEPNYIYKVVGGSSALPNDAKLGQLWGLINSGQRITGDGGTFTGKVGVDIDAQKAWMVETGSSNVVVAVIDTGVKYTNPDLAPNIFTNLAEKNGVAGVDDDANGCIDDVHGCDFPGNDGDPMDVYGHGTHVSGTIGAKGNDATDIVGVAWNVTILPVRFLGDDGSGTLADAVKSIDYATAMKVHIMNNSWGGGGFSQALLESIQRARDAGILFLAAAGNSSNDNDRSPEYPANYQVENVMAVAAIDPTGQLADFSNYGKNTVALAAPGVNVLSHTVRALESWSGTSMACPHVAGVAALLLSQDPSQPYSTLMKRLVDSARPMASIRSRVKYGMVNAYFALTNQKAPDDPDDPFSWQKSPGQGSSAHPYANKDSVQFTFQVPGASRVAVHFSAFDTESGYDKVEFINSAGAVVGTLSGKLGDTFGPVVDGDTVTIRFTADDSVTSYGFDVDGVAFQ